MGGHTMFESRLSTHRDIVSLETGDIICLDGTYYVLRGHNMSDIRHTMSRSDIVCLLSDILCLNGLTDVALRPQAATGSHWHGELLA